MASFEMKIANTEIEVIFGDAGKMKSCRVADFSKLKNLKSSLSLIKREELLRQECRKALHQARAKKYKTLCLAPLVLENFPLVGLTRVVTQEIHRFLTREKTALQKVTICLSDKKLYRIFKKEVTGYLNHLLKTLAGEPYITVDVIIELPKGIVIIERSNPPFGWALPGGFVDRDESLETAVRREAMEETHLKLENLRQFHTYSDPRRDPRFHTIDVVFIAKGKGRPQSGDDAKNLKIVPCKDLLRGVYAFDHKQIIREYLKNRR